ncbi:MAG: iron-sulfur flavoprotein [Methanohalophilus sp. T328-1]|jgi:multimeric flavodoxin WrbA|uniref:Multimeric flavodoxin WrbA n=1 Tax=Methanohalophilus euhalobius TaxID=51203 RepID=A0A285GAI6_9EURY|nr:MULTISPECIES: flavodoxin family protein [Methanohalophilus]KXS42945.1 MAG: iron-sulfur flavoprotein [Methanohalophilus sp. T328-1]RSD33897.1 MAG: isf-7 [Methanohalophilus sp.]OBZ34327.1 MAG: NADPH-dependent FMN reductase [Methanohalophilus sp. DAL1]ODV48871.1 MAG: iron-sulfur flavoprotein [Methanohalophilus sp. 2-GBenrich]RSD35117.1 MAG: isf-7 [Methanohalophilus sp.]
MKILGISGSPRAESRSGSIKVVKKIVENTGCEYELISLHGKNIGGCIACMACVEDNVCKVHDDMETLRDKIVEADAYVLGGVNYFDTLNAAMLSFMERWYQFRHREADILWGKLAVTMSLGGHNPAPATDVLNKICFANVIKVVDNVQGIGAAGCHYCGYGETCKVGIPYLLQGPDVAPITLETTPDVTKDEELMQAAEDAGKKLGDMLRSPDYSRGKTVQELMQMMEAMKAERSNIL